MKHWRAALVLQAALAAGFTGSVHAVEQQLVFGSFRDRDNAAQWAQQLTQRFDRPFQVERVHRDDGIWYRVRTHSLAAADRAALEGAAAAQGMAVWVVRGATANPDTVTATTAVEHRAELLPEGDAGVPSAPAMTGRNSGASAGESRPAEDATRRRGVSSYLDIDLGLQTRAFRQSGAHGQSRFQPSFSARMQYHRGWDDGRSSLTFTPFVRVDAEDDERTHVDVRELFLTRVGDDWEMHVGARQIFWGVTEFNHLVDIINQTDLVENLDGEEKLGQPMVQLSLVRDWGILDLFLMSGFRERTFPGRDGRLRSALPVDTDNARYASGAGRGRIDGAIRWSHQVGPIDFGVYHFSGTSRDPRFVPELRPGGEVVLVPEYHIIDQSGLDAQAIFGDWAWKLETITRSGHGGRYHAYTAGFERTLVGVFGSRGDLGLVAEYMYDQRGKRAFDTLFENDVALGTRWRANDMADTSALVGVIWDVRTREYVMTLEASRRIGSSWMAVIEGRLFGGADPLDLDTPLPQLFDGRHKTRPLQRDDFVQLELTRYF